MKKRTKILLLLIIILQFIIIYFFIRFEYRESILVDRFHEFHYAIKNKEYEKAYNYMSSFYKSKNTINDFKNGITFNNGIKKFTFFPIYQKTFKVYFSNKNIIRTYKEDGSCYEYFFIKENENFFILDKPKTISFLYDYPFGELPDWLYIRL